MTLSTATTPQPEFYLSPKIYQQEQEKIFSSVWHPIGRLEQLPEAGSYLTTTIGKENILVTKNLAGELRAMSRVCRHRAGSVGVDGGGCSKKLQCQYHGWQFDLNGDLVNVPEFEGVENFNPRNYSLPQFSVDQWNGFIFVHLGKPAIGLKDWLGEIVPEIQKAGYDFTQYKKVYHKDYVVKCNWKIYIENYLEGYHIPIAHPGLMKEIDYSKYEVRERRYHSFQYTPMKPKRPGQQRTYGEEGQESLYYWLFPLFMINVYPDNMSANYIIPLNQEETLTVFEWFVAPETENIDAEKLASFSDEVQYEDIKLCEDVQKNLHSNHYLEGRYSVKRENGVYHFHQLIHEFLVQ